MALLNLYCFKYIFSFVLNWLIKYPIPDNPDSLNSCKKSTNAIKIVAGDVCTYGQTKGGGHIRQLGPLGRVGLVVAKSVCVFVPFPCDFFRGLSL